MDCLEGNGWKFQAMDVGSRYPSIVVGRSASESKRHGCISLHEGMVVDKVVTAVMSSINVTGELVLG